MRPLITERIFFVNIRSEESPNSESNQDASHLLDSDVKMEVTDNGSLDGREQAISLMMEKPQSSQRLSKKGPSKTG